MGADGRLVCRLLTDRLLMHVSWGVLYPIKLSHSARFSHRSPNFAYAVHVLKPLADVAGEIEGVGVLVVL